MQYFPNETIPLKNLNLCEVIDEGIIVTNVYVTHMCLIKQKYFPNPEILELYQIKKVPIFIWKKYTMDVTIFFFVIRFLECFALGILETTCRQIQSVLTKKNELIKEPNKTVCPITRITKTPNLHSVSYYYIRIISIFTLSIKYFIQHYFSLPTQPSVSSLF